MQQTHVKIKAASTWPGQSTPAGRMNGWLGRRAAGRLANPARHEGESGRAAVPGRPLVRKIAIGTLVRLHRDETRRELASEELLIEK
jgi:hypothetical protein